MPLLDFHYLHWIWTTLFYSLGKNKIGESVATVLADALRVNQSLTTLKWVTILAPYWPISKVLWAWYGCPGWQWPLCGLLVLWQLVLVTTVTFLTVWTLLVEAIPASMSCQFTNNRNMEFLHRLCCYDNSNGIYLTTILKYFACVRIWCTKF